MSIDEYASAPPGAEIADAAPRTWREIHYTVHDGLTLYARDYGALHGPKTPLLCLPGLTRNSRDFHSLAERFSTTRRVLAPDYRGRGRSEYTGNYRSYSPIVEMSDVFQLMTLAHVDDAIIIGTSRGGIIAMLMAALRPSAVRAVVLNDIGAAIPPTALLRIAGYVRNMPYFQNWERAIYSFRRLNEDTFTNLSDEQWDGFARRGLIYRDGAVRTDFDPLLAKALDDQLGAIAGATLSLWPQFAALLRKPVLVIRGANSDVLAAETVQQMRSLKRDLMSVTVPHRGHPPLLDEPRALRAIDKLVAQADEIG